MRRRRRRKYGCASVSTATSFRSAASTRAAIHDFSHTAMPSLFLWTHPSPTSANSPSRRRRGRRARVCSTPSTRCPSSQRQQSRCGCPCPFYPMLWVRLRTLKIDAAELSLFESGCTDTAEFVEYHCEEYSGSVRGNVKIGVEMKGRNGKKEFVYSPVLKVNRVANVHFQMASLPRRAFRDVQPWILH